MKTFVNKLIRLVIHTKKITGAIVVVIIVFAFLLRPKQAPMLDTYNVKKDHIVVSLSVNGTVGAKKSADVFFPTSGKLAYLGVAKGDSVQEGQVLATLDQRSVQKNMEAALADYAKQRNTFDQTQDTYQNRTPDQAPTDQLKRILQNNQYDLNKAIISVELQSLVKEQSVLVIPINGIVSRADAKSAGVQVTSSTVFTIVDPTSLVFNLDVDEADISKIKTGDKVRVTLNAYGDKPFDSTISNIDFVSHTTSTGGTVYTVEVGLTDSPLPYRVGMNGNADIILGERYNTLVIPSSSLVNDDTVYVKTKNGIRPKKVTVGVKNDADAEITDGLSLGDAVVTQPSLLPKQNSAFRIPFVGRFLRRG